MADGYHATVAHGDPSPMASSSQDPDNQGDQASRTPFNQLQRMMLAAKARGDMATVQKILALMHGSGDQGATFANFGTDQKPLPVIASQRPPPTAAEMMQGGQPSTPQEIAAKLMMLQSVENRPGSAAGGGNPRPAPAPPPSQGRAYVKEVGQGYNPVSAADIPSGSPQAAPNSVPSVGQQSYLDMLRQRLSRQR